MALKRIEPGVTDKTLVTTVPNNYRDLGLSFSAKRGTVFEDGNRRGDVYKKLDIRSIEQSVENILLTNKGEKPFQPLFGSDLRRLLFELNTVVTEPQVRRTITWALETYEPRIELLDVEITDLGATGENRKVPKGSANVFLYATTKHEEARHTLVISVIARIRNSGQEIATQVNMNRLR
jgi:phage baseplate assembly protein W